MESTRLWTNFQLETTEDQSPTLRLNGAHPIDQLKSAESMHHSGGAATETLYIYGQAISWTLEKYNCKKPLTICSVGLGLGYNEILVGLLSFKSKTVVELESFEIDLELIESFKAWVHEDASTANRREQFKVYDQIFSMLSEKINFETPSIEFKTEFKNYLQKQFKENSWTIKTELNTDSIPQNSTYHLCLFDAFSQKTSGELWSALFLNQFIGKGLDTKFCLFVTYACTGLLSRTLKSHGFQVTKKIGFKGKRDSTWAERIL